jgi:hypothetical protein
MVNSRPSPSCETRSISPPVLAHDSPRNKKSRPGTAFLGCRVRIKDLAHVRWRETPPPVSLNVILMH